MGEERHVPIRVCCPAGHCITVPQVFAGRETVGPVCGLPFIIPTEGAAPVGTVGSCDPPPAEISDSRETPPAYAGASQNPIPGKAGGSQNETSDEGEAYRPSQGDSAAARWAAVWLWTVSLFTVLPGVLVMRTGDVPAWAAWLSAAAVIQACATGVTLVFPDWSARRAVGWGLAGTAAVFAYLTAVVGLSPAARSLPLDLDAWRREATHWLICLAAVHGTAAYLCFRSAARWKRRTELLARTRRRRPFRFTAAFRSEA